LPARKKVNVICDILLILGAKLNGLTVVTLSSGSRVATLEKPVIDRKSLEVPAFKCHAGGQELALSTRDIRQFNPSIILINSEDDLVETTEIVRLQPLIQENFPLIGVTVKTESGTKLGNVNDFVLDTSSFMVQKLHIKRPIFKSLLLEGLTIDRNQIVDISPKLITVHDATIKEPLGIVQPVVPE
jgi:uncharacterized protein YrrD